MATYAVSTCVRAAGLLIRAYVDRLEYHRRGEQAQLDTAGPTNLRKKP